MSELERVREFLLGAHQQEYVSLLDTHIAQDKEREEEAELVIHGLESRIDEAEAKLEEREAELEQEKFRGDSLASLAQACEKENDRRGAALEEIMSHADSTMMRSLARAALNPIREGE